VGKPIIWLGEVVKETGRSPRGKKLNMGDGEKGGGLNHQPKSDDLEGGRGGGVFKNIGGTCPTEEEIYTNKREGKGREKKERRDHESGWHPSREREPKNSHSKPSRHDGLGGGEKSHLKGKMGVQKKEKGLMT